VRAPRLLPLAAAAALLLPSCLSTEELERPPAVNLSGEEFDVEGAAPPGASLGLEVEANEGDALERLEVLPGARVRAVPAGGPAALAGIRAGDVVLSLGDVAVEGREAFLALEREVPAGRTVKLEVRRGTTVFEASLTPAPLPAGAAPVELYRADPLRLRAGLRTVVVERPGGRRPAVEVARVFPRSPLPAAGIGPGERILALEGREVGSAQELVRRCLEEHEPGQRVLLTCLRAGKEARVPVTLWAPRRRVTRLVLPVLFHYEWSLRPRRTRWSVLDLWLISLLELRREEGEREVRVLSFLRFATGRGELAEDPREVEP
jgi:S1-C subfamily serine protease